ncbi:MULTISPECIES: LytTR family DNA-binding domain-containing protein [Ruminococcus]|jgi:DNA-binding LytR/AlgR family response regulator|uniref:LytTR family DNA-binding domain-containing protein n=1 Tax=Ruminococcus TaxID=1263 RepID=UPI00048A8877|nr:MULTISPECIES: LytTR family DNA-binding domain-containing protein [Ruminococcus]HNZ98441.1 LytTR family DNA-binding domain-containing protein [Ruminococcus sp.]HOH85745.1 LytTR family DNA-binding domain-containing protein [Ruminococcus sp.]
MKIIIESPQPDEEDSVIIRCASPDQRLVSMLLSFQTANTELTGYLDDKIVRLDYRDVYYFEANENRVFAYYQSEVYEVKYKLYELEELFSPMDFVRCSKSMIVNMEKIEYLSPLFSGKLEAHLKNGEKVVISRQYVHSLKVKLGIEEVE